MTEQDKANIERMAQELMARATPQEEQMAEAKINSMNPQQRARLGQTGMPPREYFFRTMAVRKYMMSKQAQFQPQAQAQASQGPPGRPPGGMPGGFGATPGAMPARPGMPGAPNGNNTFGGNIQQIMSLQQNAMKDQEAGQMVVPASQGISSRGNFQQGMPNNPGAASMGHVANGQRQFPPQPGNVPGRTNGPQAPMGLRAPTGAANGGGSMTPQPSPAASNVNQPMNRSAQQPAGPNGQSTPRPGTQTPAPGPAQNGPRGQQPAPNAAPAQPNQMAQLMQQMLQSFPKEMQERFLQQPADAKMRVFAQWQQKRRAQMHAMNGGAPGNNSQPTMSGAPALGMTNSAQPQASPANGMARSMQAPSDASGVGRPDGNAGMNAVQQQPQRPLPQGQPQPGPNRMPIPPLTPDQMRLADQQPFPRPLLNKNLMEVPENLRTWADLKAWVAQSPNSISPNVKGAILQFQAAFWHSMVQKFQRERAQNGAAQGGMAAPASGNGAGPPSAATAPTAPMDPSQPQAPNSNQVANMQRQAATMPIQVTPRDIQTARERFAQLRDSSDEQIRAVVARNSLMSMNQGGNRSMGPNQPFSGDNQPNSGQPSATNPPGATNRGSRPPSAQVTNSAAPNMARQGAAPPATAQQGIKRPNLDEAAAAGKPAAGRPPQRGNGAAASAVGASQDPRDASISGAMRRPPPAPQQPANAGPKMVPTGTGSEAMNQYMQQAKPHIDRLFAEVRNSMVQKAPVPMDENTKAQIRGNLLQLRPVIPQTSKMLLIISARLRPAESQIRELIRLVSAEYPSVP